MKLFNQAKDTMNINKFKIYCMNKYERVQEENIKHSHESRCKGPGSLNVQNQYIVTD